jgi:microcompartment protein CcmK/EutM
MNFRGADSGQPIIALDTMDSGIEDVVIYVTSAEAAIPFQPGLTPTDATIVGIVDRVDHESWTYRAT